MSTSIKVTTWTENGAIKMPASKRAEIDAFYRKYSDRNIEVKFSLLPKRSIKQNAYMWSCVYPIVMEGMNEYGNNFDIDKTHEFCKLTFNSEPVLGAGGEIIGKVAASTTQLNTEEFSQEYIEAICRFAAEELHRVIPPPNSQSTLFATYENDLKAIIIQ